MTVTVPETEEFRPWPKTPRLFADNVITVTEKIDGTNGAVVITEDGVHAQSRNRWLTPKDDNFGFASWVEENADKLREVLGVGWHFGEWWGHGINRGYACEKGDRRFSLFNTAKWEYLNLEDFRPDIPGLTTVPVLYEGAFDLQRVVEVAHELWQFGSVAKPGYKNPEGICLYHKRANQIFKWPFTKGNA